MGPHLQYPITAIGGQESTRVSVPFVMMLVCIIRGVISEDGSTSLSSGDTSRQAYVEPRPGTPSGWNRGSSKSSAAAR